MLLFKKRGERQIPMGAATRWRPMMPMNSHQEHTMKCPTCTDTALVMSERQGVEIDYCPQCRGVWLDRGELDKLIERSATMAPAPAGQVAARSQPRFVDSDHHHGHGRQGYRKKSWLSDIFD
jgi:Zn-finger nucleic acid-binding protein